MTTHVRSKMSCNKGVSDRPYVNFYAVYEGSSALQKISENAIFGDATPCGSCHLDGADYSDRFVNGEEYYLDLTLIEPREGVLLKRKLRQTYVTPELDRVEGGVTMFRWASVEVLNAAVEMGIRNPGAVDALDSHAEVWLSIRPATGRKSDQEIALRREMLAEHLKDLYGYGKSHPDSFAITTARLERALRRAEGQDY